VCHYSSVWTSPNQHQPTCTDPTWPRLYDALVLELSRSLERKKQFSKGRLHFPLCAKRSRLADRQCIHLERSARQRTCPSHWVPKELYADERTRRSCGLSTSSPPLRAFHSMCDSSVVRTQYSCLHCFKRKCGHLFLPCLVSSDAIFYCRQHTTGGDCLEQAVVARMGSVYIRSVDTRYNSVHTVQSRYETVLACIDSCLSCPSPKNHQSTEKSFDRVGGIPEAEHRQGPESSFGPLESSSLWSKIGWRDSSKDAQYFACGSALDDLISTIADISIRRRGYPQRPTEVVGDHCKPSLLLLKKSKQPFVRPELSQSPRYVRILVHQAILQNAGTQISS
jgi:hypothetical protein